MNTETTDTVYFTDSGQFVPVNKLVLIGAVQLDGKPMRAANYYTCTFLDGSSIDIAYEFLEEAHTCRTGLLKAWEDHGKSSKDSKVSHITTASNMQTVAVGVEGKAARVTTASIRDTRRLQVQNGLLTAIQDVLDNALEKGNVTLTPVGVAGQVLPELTALCWHFLEAHKGFRPDGENSMGEEFVPRVR